MEYSKSSSTSPRPVEIPGKGDYLYLAAVDFVKSLKKGAAFGECCPMLNDISQLPSWSKVNKGMQRLYEGTGRSSHRNDYPGTWYLVKTRLPPDVVEWRTIILFRACFLCFEISVFAWPDNGRASNYADTTPITPTTVSSSKLTRFFF